MAKGTAEAQWLRDIKKGDGTVKLGSGLYVGTYSFGTRFESLPGTNPEELLAAAHAACFSMALSLILGKAGHDPKSIRTTGHVTIESDGEGFRISSSELATVADVPGISEDAFLKLAEVAKNECPVSKALSGTNIVLRARLSS